MPGRSQSRSYMLNARMRRSRADRRKYERYFHELAPRLSVARNLELAFDRLLARRFNGFDYLRTNELGLSRLVADLLNPRASHAQGARFLRALPERLPDRVKQFVPPGLALEACEISVVVEHVIPSGRRIDVVVRIVAPRGEIRCLAIENKPYAGDLDNQSRTNSRRMERTSGEIRSSRLSSLNLVLAAAPEVGGHGELGG